MPLAVSQETYRLVVIKNRIRDADSARRAISGVRHKVTKETAARRKRNTHGPKEQGVKR